MPRDGAKTKKLLTETALQLFREKGYGNVSVQDICDAADVKRATFYYYFPSKDSVVDTFFENGELSHRDHVAVITSDNTWLKLWLIARTTTLWTRETGPDVMGMLMVLSLQNGRMTFQPEAESYSRETVLQIMEKGRSTGQMDFSGDAATMYAIYRNTCIGFCFDWCLAKGGFDLEEVLHDVLIRILHVSDACVEGERAYCERGIL